ncbi:hypothetical protein Pmar_PMAR009059 [Perkinsus marinus ATCC 50983]|uniref:Uncharacterized protein n=2 Tax=Perkinsus marinus (strain ATCC 50983 / TXsc) TaxID=423536 RepID=C5LQ31_PERM5|nr:hypothetical protein Pmar_PMAR009059 [Perkinsus marinus ATCC 50983]EER01139.1 hypothetical protein Pmar_PMAR009059 [Perkinsus marinus ATCC 50983]|eukprot:XP_002768421.1 hypothetical protein Pmar_PMAR009059 [Perkinsus marinus ATCC 50983]
MSTTKATTLPPTDSHNSDIIEDDSTPHDPQDEENKITDEPAAVAAAEALDEEILEKDETSEGRRIIIHVDVPSVMHRPASARGYTTDLMAQDEEQSAAAAVKEEEKNPQPDGTDTVLITYMDYLNMRYGEEEEVSHNDDGEGDGGIHGGEETKGKEDIINELLLEFTSKKSSPGAKLRAEFDQIIKCLSLPLPVRKGLGLPSKVNIRQNDADSSVDTGSTGTKGSGMFRYGLYNLLPSFLNMIIDFAHTARDFAIVLRDTMPIDGDDDDDPTSLLTEDAASVVEELQLLTEGKHPVYCGKYKTRKIVMDGTAPQSIVPTEYRGYSEVYAGLVHEMLPEGRIISIIERPMMSTTDDSDTRPPPREVLINPADTNIQHIYITADPTSVTVMDVLSNTYRATTQSNYFKDLVQEAIARHTTQVALGTRHCCISVTSLPQLRIDKEVDMKAPVHRQESIMQLTPRSYLRKRVLPVLAPAINEAARDRPEDPATYIAMYMLKHRHGYNKVIEINSQHSMS